MSAIDAWDSMGLAARVILLILAVFAFLLVFIVIDRFVAYRRAERPAGPPALRDALQRRMHTLAAIKVTGRCWACSARCSASSTPSREWP